MKKIFNLIVSCVLLAGFSACNKDGSDNPSLPPAPVPTVNYKGLTFISSGNSTVCLAKVGAPDEITLEYSTDESQWNPYTIGEKISLATAHFYCSEPASRKISHSARLPIVTIISRFPVPSLLKGISCHC